MTEAEQKLWKVSISYIAHCIDGAHQTEISFNTVGKDESEALQKAHGLFSEQEGAKELLEKGIYKSNAVQLDNYREKIKPYLSRLSLPKIDGTEAGRYKLMPRVSADGRNIEYIVNEASVK